MQQEVEKSNAVTPLRTVEPPADAVRLDDVKEVIASAGEKTDYIVDQLLAKEAIIGMAASAGTGKTPLTHMLLRSAITGEPFLGYEVHEPVKRIAYMTAEGKKPHGRALIRFGVADALRDHPDVVFLPYRRERNLHLTWPEAVGGVIEALVDGADPNEPKLLVVEILTDHADFGKDGENDSARMSEVFDTLKKARDAGVTPVVQMQTPKSVNDLSDDEISLDIFRGSGGGPGHFDIAFAYKQPKERNLRGDLRYFKILRNRLDGLPERHAFYVQQLSDRDFICHDQVPKPDLRSEIVRAVSLGEAEAGSQKDLYNVGEIRNEVGRAYEDVRVMVEEMETEGALLSSKVSTGKRGPKKTVYYLPGGKWDGN